MTPLPPTTPLGLPAPASVFEAIYLAGSALFHTLFELSLGIALLLIVQRLIKRGRLLSDDAERSFKDILPVSALLTIATAVAPLIIWYTLFGSAMYLRLQSHGAAWLEALSSVFGALALAGLLLAAVGFREGKREPTIKRGYRIFIVSALAKLVASAMITASPSLILLTGFAAGSAVLGLARPRNAAWLLSSTALIAFSTLADDIVRFQIFKQRLAPLFRVEDYALNWQIAPTVLFFIFSAAALIVVSMMIRWISIPLWCKPEDRETYSQDHIPRVRLL
jgi:hypothetical protein